MLGNDAMEFLKTLHHLDEIWKHHDDAEYNDRQLTQFAERYHEHKLKLLGITDVVGQSEQLVCDKCGYPMFYHKPDDIMYCHGCDNTKSAN